MIKLVSVVALLSLILGAFSLNVNAADQGSKTGKLSMKQQHETMILLNEQWAGVKQALEKNDFRAAAEGISKMERTSARIDKFRPHRNTKLHDEFVSYSKAFAKNLAQLRQAAEAEDQSASKELTGPVEESCNTCHAKFAGGHSHH